MLFVLLLKKVRKVLLCAMLSFFGENVWEKQKEHRRMCTQQKVQSFYRNFLKW